MLAYLDSQGGYTLPVGHSDCVTLIPKEKSEQCHWFACYKSEGKKGGVKNMAAFATYFEREDRIHTMLED